jgi:hypothetical protein
VSTPPIHNIFTGLTSLSSQPVHSASDPRKSTTRCRSNPATIEAWLDRAAVCVRCWVGLVGERAGEKGRGESRRRKERDTRAGKGQGERNDDIGKQNPQKPHKKRDSPPSPSPSSSSSSSLSISTAHPLPSLLPSRRRTGRPCDDGVLQRWDRSPTAEFAITPALDLDPQPPASTVDGVRPSTRRPTHA